MYYTYKRNLGGNKKIRLALGLYNYSNKLVTNIVLKLTIAIYNLPDQIW